MAKQARNADMVDLLETDFVGRNELVYSWKGAVSSILTLPGLRAAWPMSPVGYQAANQCPDLSGQANHLTANATIGTIRWGYVGLAQFAYFDATGSQYLSRADGGAGNWADILGTEAYIYGTQKGLTLGGWFYISSIATAQGLITKGTSAVAASSYELFQQNAATIRFRVSDGVAYVTAASTQATTVAGWNFCVGRYIPSTSVSTYVNGTLDSTVAAVPAAIQDSGTQVCIGAFGSPGLYFTGFSSLCWLCAAALSDQHLTALFESQRALFGV